MFLLQAPEVRELEALHQHARALAQDAACVAPGPMPTAGGAPVDSFLEGPVFDDAGNLYRDRHPLGPHLPHRRQPATGIWWPSTTASRTA
jgi:gluconolactonase